MAKKRIAVKKQFSVFIDNNIYLQCFGMSSKKIIYLKELKKLIDKKGINLILPQQTKDEYFREKEIRIKGSRENKNIKNLILPELPPLIKNLPEVKKERSRIEAVLKKIKKIYNEKFEAKIKEIEKLIQYLFKKAKHIKESNKTINKAYNRHLKGNPPGQKEKSYGDEIVWETLLENWNEGLAIIANNSGWFATKARKKLNPFLKKEWEEKTKKKN